MLTYQIRPRVFHVERGASHSFPADCTVQFHFRPLQPFGMEAGGGRTAVRATPAKALFNANTGAFSIESCPPLSPLSVRLEEPPSVTVLEGNVVHIQRLIGTLPELENLIQTVFFTLPTLLNVQFADPPFVERVDGNIGSAPFRWELAEWRIVIPPTSQEEQQAMAAAAWRRLRQSCDARRLAAGLHYFHVACRLSRVGSTAGEFVAEVILNHAKSLEALFPPPGDGQTREAVRHGLRSLGFTEDETEGSFLPAMVLRNEIDVAHVELGMLTTDQLKVVHALTNRTELAMHNLFERLFERIEAGEFTLADYHLDGPSQKTVALIEKLRRHTPPDALGV